MFGRSVQADIPIESDCIKKYEEQTHKIFVQLQTAQNNLIILKQIIDFPFRILQPSIGFIFWEHVEHALFDSTLLALSITVGETKGYYSLHRFYARIVDHYLRTDIPKNVRGNLETKFAVYQKRTEKIGEEIKQLRDKHIAHKDRDADDFSRGMAYTRLQDAVEAANDLFDALSFAHVVLERVDYEFGPDARSHFTDVEQLLGFVANTSLYIRNYSEGYMRDDQAESYAELTDDQRRIVDFWRERVKDMGISGD